MKWARVKAVKMGMAIASAFLLSGSFAKSRAQIPEVSPAECLIPEAETEVKAGIFGSQAILQSCWTEKELRGSPGDKKITRKTAYPGPPARPYPSNLLPPLGPALQNSIRDVKPLGGKKVVALTFDICEQRHEVTGYDADIFNYLRAYHISATFFISGKWMLTHKEKTMQLMADPLFEIGNHAWTHDDLRVEQGIKMDDQILWPQAQYELVREELAQRPCALSQGPEEMEKIPLLPDVFRFPYGACSRQALDFLAENGLPAIQWSIVTGDPSKKQTAKGIAAEVMRDIKPGAIIICHANGMGHGTANSLPLFIPKLKKLGYQFLTVSELLATGPALAAKQCYELKPGDNYRYDKLYGSPK